MPSQEADGAGKRHSEGALAACGGGVCQGGPTPESGIAAKAKQDRLDHVALIDDEALGGQGALASVLAKQGQLEGSAVGGCCDLSTSVHHLVDKLGAELGYLMSKDTGYDVEDCITLATKGLKLRVARRVWRDYYRHSFARQHCAGPREARAARGTPKGPAEAA